jgi:hypothetical protein
MSGMRAPAASRAAEALLRTLGGTSIYLRTPMAAAAGDAGQLGIAGATTQDIALAPVVVRHSGSSATRRELLVPASALARACDIQDTAAAQEFFSAALGIVLRGTLLRVEAFAAEELDGAPYLYRVVVCE